MAAEWFGGVLNASSWHKLESVEVMPTAEAMIRRGEELGVYPTGVSLETMTTESGLTVPGQAIVADYLDGERRCHKAVSDRYHFLDPVEWRETIRAAVAAGAKPAGAFALGKMGSKVLATFEIDGSGDFRNYLNLADSLDQSCAYIAGGSSVRVVCANTFAAWMGQDGKRAARIRHTKSIGDRAEVLRGAIEDHVQSGQVIANLYRDAREARLARPDMEALLAELWPVPSDEDVKDGKVSAAKATRAKTARMEAVVAMRRPENDEGPTVASFWNAATWTVDRTADARDTPARPRKMKGDADALESLLFGSRGARIEKVRQTMVRILRPDGSEESVTAHTAAAEGVDLAQVGRAVLDDMLSN
jgi:hypothetical protein